MNYNHLVIVIGPSGSGKDTLISGAKTALANDPDFYFTPREITRPSSVSGESHIAVSEEEFLRRRDSGDYAICWHAHDVWYGIDRSIEDRLAEGKVVVFNGSRAAIKESKRRFPGARIVFVYAPEDVLAERLTARRRESEQQLKERLARNLQFSDIPEGVTVLSNTGSLAKIVDEFLVKLHLVLSEEETVRMCADDVR